MSKIHDLSHVAPLAEFDIFSVPSTQYSIERDLVTEHTPVNTLSMGSCIDFRFVTNEDEYVKLKESLLHVKMRVKISKKNGKNVGDADWTHVDPVANLLHSMFKQVDLVINSTSVIATPQNYGYRAFFDAFCGFSDSAKRSFLMAAGGPISSSKDMFAPKPPAPKDGSGRVVELMGILHIDLALQHEALLGQLEYKFQFTPQSPDFFLKVTNTNIVPSVELLDMTLHIHRARVTTPILEAHNLALNAAPAKYPFTRSEVRKTQLSGGIRDAVIDNFVPGQLPRWAILALVDNNAYNGELQLNPFDFQHFDISHVAFYLDGTQYPSRPYNPNFSDGSYIREYLGLYQTLNQITPDPSFILTPEEYGKGSTLFGVNFAPDLSDGCGIIGHLNPVRRGSLRIEIKFRKPLPKVVSVLLYCEFDNLIEINKERQVLPDFRYANTATT